MCLIKVAFRQSAGEAVRQPYKGIIKKKELLSSLYALLFGQTIVV